MDHRVPLSCFTPSAKRQLALGRTVKGASTGTRLRLNLWPGDARKDDHVIYGHNDKHQQQRQHLLSCWCWSIRSSIESFKGYYLMLGRQRFICSLGEEGMRMRKGV